MKDNKLVVGFIGNGKSANRYHMPFVLRRPDKFIVKSIFDIKIRHDIWEKIPGVYYTEDVNELLNEVLNIIRKDTKSDVSILFNELVLSNIDQKYIDLAKKNIYDRKPFNSQFTKYQKKTLKEHGII